MSTTPPPPEKGATANEIFLWILWAFGGSMGRFEGLWALRIRDHRAKVQQMCVELAARLARTDVPKLRNPGAWANQTYQAICNGEARPE